MRLEKNFNLSEFRCKDGTSVPFEYYDNVKELAHNLQILRDYLGKPIMINSAYRSPEYNRRIGGAKRSQHLEAKAADISIRDLTPKQVVRAIKKLIRLGLMKDGGIGLYNGFVHYDIRDNKARWDFSSRFNF